MSNNYSLAYLEGRSFIIGREGHIYLNHPAISKHHAEISVRKGQVFPIGL